MRSSDAAPPDLSQVPRARSRASGPVGRVPVGRVPLSCHLDIPGRQGTDTPPNQAR